MSEVNEFLWELVYDATGFHQEDDPATGYQLREAIKALCAPYEPVYSLVRERDDQPAPFALALDPDEVPAQWLPYLAQWVGAIPTPDMDEAHLRAEIKQPTGWRRGELASIKLAAQKTLTGTKRVIVRSRTPEVGHHYIRTLASETPEPSRTEAVLRANVPAWEALDYEAISGVSWADIAVSFKDWSAVKAAFIDWADLADTLPSELPEP